MDSQYEHEHLTHYVPSLYDDSLQAKPTYDGLGGISPFPYSVDAEFMSLDSSPLSFRSLSPGPSPTIVPGGMQSVADMAPLFQEVNPSRDAYNVLAMPGYQHRIPSYIDIMSPIEYDTYYSYAGLDLYCSSSSSSAPVDSSMGSSSQPLTVSPQLLQSPTSEYHNNAGEIESEENDQYFYDSDMDAEGETDDEDDDDEYTDPSTAPPALRRSTRATRTSTTSYNHTASHSSHSTRPIPSSSRQSTSESEQLIRTRARRAEGKGKPNYDSVNANGDFVCETCGHVCKATRKVDFRRHVNTHYPSMVSGATICCGIPVEQRNIGQWRGKISANAPIKTFFGRQMVGGCGRIFSRMDALHRHIELQSNTCVGDVKGVWHPSKLRD